MTPRTAVVTGGGTGIGRALAPRGLDVVITGRRPGTPVAVVGFPTSPEAGHVTGQVVPVDGGAHLGR